jgi:hypothetical protein
MPKQESFLNSSVYVAMFVKFFQKFRNCDKKLFELIWDSYKKLKFFNSFRNNNNRMNLNL